MHRAAEFLEEKFPQDVLEVVEFRGDTTVVLDRANLLAIMQTLKDDPATSYKYLSMVAAVDYHPASPRFAVVYNLYSHRHKNRLTIKVFLDDAHPALDSVAGIWATADYHEREAYDLMGIFFKGHPNLKRILLPADWRGFPLRKEDPQRGE